LGITDCPYKGDIQKYKLAHVVMYTVTDVGGWRGRGRENIVLY